MFHREGLAITGIVIQAAADSGCASESIEPNPHDLAMTRRIPSVCPYGLVLYSLRPVYGEVWKSSRVSAPFCRYVYTSLGFVLYIVPRLETSFWKGEADSDLIDRSLTASPK